MKLRNKKTGEIIECPMIRMSIGVCDLMRYEFPNSLAKLNEEYEDYKPKEPLIKEQEVRDVVKLWAKANLIPHNANSIEYQLADTLEGTFSEFWCNSLHIVFWSNVAPNAIHGKCYSIDELCGEEE